MMRHCPDFFLGWNSQSIWLMFGRAWAWKFSLKYDAKVPCEFFTCPPSTTLPPPKWGTLSRRYHPHPSTINLAAQVLPLMLQLLCSAPDTGFGTKGSPQIESLEKFGLLSQLRGGVCQSQILIQFFQGCFCCNMAGVPQSQPTKSPKIT